MHLNTEQIRDLAKAYLEHSILNDEQLSYKIHMSECDECYENFCASLAVRKVMYDRGLVVSKEQDKRPCLEINIYEKTIEVVNQLKEQTESTLWNFIKKPQLALGRGTASENNETYHEEIYESIVSEYSYISRENGNLNITLDQEQYDTSQLAVRYICNGVEQVKEFQYDEDSEVCSVIVDEKLADDGKIEIFYK